MPASSRLQVILRKRGTSRALPGYVSGDETALQEEAASRRFSVNHLTRAIGTGQLLKHQLGASSSQATPPAAEIASSSGRGCVSEIRQRFKAL